MNTKKIVVIALLIALEIILTRFLAIQTPTIRISLGFVPIAIIAIMYGPIYAGVAAAVADFMGVSFFSAITPFPGFTVTAALMGFVFGLFLYNHRDRHLGLVRICMAVLIVTIVLQFGLDTLWLQIITGRGFFEILPTRIVRTLIMLPLQLVCINLLVSERFYRHIARFMTDRSVNKTV